MPEILARTERTVTCLSALDWVRAVNRCTVVTVYPFSCVAHGCYVRSRAVRLSLSQFNVIPNTNLGRWCFSSRCGCTCSLAFIVGASWATTVCRIHWVVATRVSTLSRYIENLSLITVASLAGLCLVWDPALSIFEHFVTLPTLATRTGRGWIN
jgi:hypothetical protein